MEHKLSVLYCSPQNGVSERKNRTIVEMARTMLSDVSLHKHFWGETALTATYLINCLPIEANNNNMTLYELCNNKIPNRSNIRTFGCKACVYAQNERI